MMSKGQIRIALKKIDKYLLVSFDHKFRLTWYALNLKALTEDLINRPPAVQTADPEDQVLNFTHQVGDFTHPPSGFKKAGHIWNACAPAGMINPQA